MLLILPHQTSPLPLPANVAVSPSPDVRWYLSFPQICYNASKPLPCQAHSSRSCRKPPLSVLSSASTLPETAFLSKAHSLVCPIPSSQSSGTSPRLPHHNRSKSPKWKCPCNSSVNSPPSRQAPCVLSMQCSGGNSCQDPPRCC